MTTPLQKLAKDPRRSSAYIAGCGVLIVLLGVLGLMGWIGGVAVLVQPTRAFQPVRPLACAVMIVIGFAIVAQAQYSTERVRKLALTTLVMAAAGALLGYLNLRWPWEDLVEAHALSMGVRWRHGVAVFPALAFMVAALSLLALNSPRAGRRLAAFVYSTGIVMVGVAVMASIVHVGHLQTDLITRWQLGVALQPIIAAILLGLALAIIVARRRAAPFSPPRIAPRVAGLTALATVLVLWLVLRAEEDAERHRLAELAAKSFGRAVETQLENVERALLRIASTSSEITYPTPSLRRGVELLMEDVPGLDQVIGLANSEVAVALPTAGSVPPAVTRVLTERFRELLDRQAISPVLNLHVVELPSDRWSMAVVAPMRDDAALLVGVIDEARFLTPLLADSSAGFAPMLLRTDSTPPADARIFAHRFGARTIRFAMRPVSGTRHTSNLPEVVLGFGIGVALLLTMVLQLLRTSWSRSRLQEAQRLQEALESAADAVWEFDFTTNLGRRSASQVRQLGYDPRALGRNVDSWLALIHPEDKDRVAATLAQDRHAAELQEDELIYRVRAADGTYHTIVDRGRVIERTPDRRPKVMLGISADITERQRADQQRAASEHRFKAMFEAAQQFQALLDASGRVLEANTAALNMVGVARDEVVDAAFIDGPWWKTDAAHDAIVEHMEEARAGNAARFEIEANITEGRTGVLDFSLTPLLDAEGNVMQILAEGRDITERRRVEEALREIGALTTMGRLAARVAHEINNPLAGIQNSFLLLADAIPEDHPHRRFVGAIEREIQRIAVVTRQLYETYRPDQNSNTGSSVVVAVNDAVTFLNQVNRARSVRIAVDVARAPSVVPVPDALLRQTLYNLVQNAVEASPPNGEVQVTATQDGDACIIVVSDHGSGVPPHIRERIWDAFFSTKDVKVKTSGMGLGLALVRQSVEAVGGSITLEDTPGGGATFTVRLPMTPVMRVRPARVGASVAG